MKKALSILFLLLLFTGCTTSKNSSSVIEIDYNNKKFNQLVQNPPKQAVALVVNFATDEQIKILQPHETLKLQQTENTIFVIPKDNRSGIAIYSQDIEADGTLFDVEKVYENPKPANDFALAMQALRPEGAPAYRIAITTEDGTEYSYVISYNGKDGNENLEYITEKAS